MSRHTLEPGEDHGSLASYASGFALSLVLTALAYLLATHSVGSGILVPALVALAMLQLAVQLVFFLHLNSVRSGWKLFTFGFMALIVAILVFGTLWIMRNLNYNMGTPAEVSTFIQKDEGITAP